MKKYQPPYTITPTIIHFLPKIAEKVGYLSAKDEGHDNLRLRRINHIRTIQGTLAIEGNTLSEEQITAILDGKLVIAPLREIQEAKNAIKAYSIFEKWRPYEEKDLLNAHQIIMAGLMEQAGLYRSGGVGVIGDGQVLHMAPPAKQVPKLMADLFDWLKNCALHPLVASSIFHYEFEFIHPFADGNGRLGRFWQSLILHNWNPLFIKLPVESLVFANQKKYYQALNASTKLANCSPFVEFMLIIIHEALNELTPQVSPQVSPQVNQLLGVIKGEMSREELQTALGLKDRKSFGEHYLK
ncbi:MAG: Fic family protein, partial [Candidatus Adiutrix sp.]